MKIKCDDKNFFKIYNEMQGVGFKATKLYKNKKAKVHFYTTYILFYCLVATILTLLSVLFLKDYDVSGKDIIVAASNAGWIGHCFNDYKTLLANSNIKGELDLVFSSNENERDKMLTSQAELDEWIEKL